MTDLKEQLEVFLTERYGKSVYAPKVKGWATDFAAQAVSAERAKIAEELEKIRKSDLDLHDFAKAIYDFIDTLKEDV